MSTVVAKGKGDKVRRPKKFVSWHLDIIGGEVGRRLASHRSLRFEFEPRLGQDCR